MEQAIFEHALHGMQQQLEQQTVQLPGIPQAGSSDQLASSRGRSAEAGSGGGAMANNGSCSPAAMVQSLPASKFVR